MITTDMKVADIAARNYAGAFSVFEQYGIDACCGGKKTLEQACIELGVDADQVLSDLARTDALGHSGYNNHIGLWSLRLLCDYITENHHGFLKVTVPAIQQRLFKVRQKHGEKFPVLHDVNLLFAEMTGGLFEHLYREEEILFPYVRRMEHAKCAGEHIPAPFFRSVKHVIAAMESEHNGDGERLRELRRLTGNYTPPDGTCATFKALYEELHTFEQDLHQHIYLENHILFPRAIALESEVVA